MSLIKTIVSMLGVGGIAYILGLGPEKSSKKRSDSDPLEIAKHRYAQGEIDRDEYREMREELEK
jgi:uncharacterized membrane protein